MRTKFLITAFFFVGCAQTTATTKPSSFEPWGTSALSSPSQKRSEGAGLGPIAQTAMLWFSVYKQTLSRVDGSTCNFTPSCSRFAFEAVRDHGPYGLMLGFGRLHKNHLDRRHYQYIAPFLADPVSNYTFWLRTPRRDDFTSYSDLAHAWFQHVRVTRD